MEISPKRPPEDLAYWIVLAIAGLVLLISIGLAGDAAFAPGDGSVTSSFARVIYLAVPAVVGWLIIRGMKARSLDRTDRAIRYLTGAILAVVIPLYLVLAYA